MNKQVAMSIIISGLLIVGAILFVSDGSATDANTGNSSVVSNVDGKQFIDISAKGGYSPRIITAKAGAPTTLRVKTRGTYDCSGSLVIPSLRYQKLLQPSGVEEIIISAEQAQGAMRGLCAMGMYSFQIRFQ